MSTSVFFSAPFANRRGLARNRAFRSESDIRCVHTCGIQYSSHVKTHCQSFDSERRNGQCIPYVCTGGACATSEELSKYSRFISALPCCCHLLHMSNDSSIENLLFIVSRPPKRCPSAVRSSFDVPFLEVLSSLENLNQLNGQQSCFPSSSASAGELWDLSQRNVGGERAVS